MVGMLVQVDAVQRGMIVRPDETYPEQGEVVRYVDRIEPSQVVLGLANGVSLTYPSGTLVTRVL